MEFIPDKQQAVTDVPYYEDVAADAGWKGHSTSKSLETLKSEVTQSVAKIGGMVVGFQQGTYHIGEQNRPGMMIHYTIEVATGRLVPGRIDLAALPIRPVTRGGNREERLRKNTERTVKMALFNLRDALQAQWILQSLSPGYAPLMPWMLAKDDKTVSQLWSESSVFKQLLPPSDAEFEGDIIDA